MTNVAPDRLRELLDAVLAELDRPARGPDLAAAASTSRFHFDRLVAAAAGESPVSMRRRVLLERAAHSIADGTSVTDAAIAAGYESLDGFTRAFTRLHGVTPGRFRTEGRDHRIPAPNGIHFQPPGNLYVTARPGGRRAAPQPPRGPTGPLDVLFAHHRATTDGLLAAAASLAPEQLDAVVRPGFRVLDFDGPDDTVRRLLDNLVWTEEVWVAAIAGRATGRPAPTDVATLRWRHDRAAEELTELVRRIDDEQRWDDAVVDALCDPPQLFTLAGIVAHVVAFSTHRRLVLHDVLSELGVTALPTRCPLEFSRTPAPPRPST